MENVLEAAANQSERRYRDAYRAARILDFWGFVLKVVGWIIGIAAGFVVGSLVNRGGMYTQGHSELNGLLIGLGAGGVAGTVIWVAGVLIQARGQEMKALLDSAICGNIFLSEEQKARAMFLSLRK